jgi:putative transposase
MQLMKGESSKWASDTGLLPKEFGWESQYYASSVSGRNVPAVRAYIKNQQAHHASVTFATELTIY